MPAVELGRTCGFSHCGPCAYAELNSCPFAIIRGPPLSDPRGLPFLRELLRRPLANIVAMSHSAAQRFVFSASPRLRGEDSLSHRFTWSVIQFTSHVLPPSSENACSKCGAFVPIFDQINRTKTALPFHIS